MNPIVARPEESAIRICYLPSNPESKVDAGLELSEIIDWLALSEIIDWPSSFDYGGLIADQINQIDRLKSQLAE